MVCEKCGNSTEESWEYCPFCGSFLKSSIATRFPAFGGLEDILKDIDNEFRKMEEAFKCIWPDSKTLEPVKGGGISIRISSKDDREPDIDVEAFGDYQDKAPEIEKRLGVKRERTPPKVTKEPKTLIEQDGGKMVLRTELPGVKSEDDIDVKRMAESIEIRAYADDMAYFTLFCIPPDSKILSKSLENEEFVIEVST